MRGFAISGAVSDEEAAALAGAAEESGYTSVWLTVVATTDPIGRLQAALASTQELTVGLGVVPADRAGELAFGKLPQRAVVGLGAGSGTLGRLQREVEAFKRANRGARVAIAGYGPRVLTLAQELADCVVLNWMTPERLRWAVSLVAPRPVFLYVASSIGPDGAVAIERALAEMRRFPYHARHQEAMAARELVGATHPSQLARYEHATPVVNPIGTSKLEERLHVLRFFAP